MANGVMGERSVLDIKLKVNGKMLIYQLRPKLATFSRRKDRQRQRKKEKEKEKEKVR